MTMRHPVDEWLAARRLPLPPWIVLQTTAGADTRAYTTTDGIELFVRCGTLGSHRYMTMVVTGLRGSVERATLTAIREAFFLPGRGVELRRTDSFVDVVQLWQMVEAGS